MRNAIAFLAMFWPALLLGAPPTSPATPARKVKVGVTSILTGDLGVLGQNVVNTVETYRRHFLRHNIEFTVEDARLGSADGLKAFQKLISIEKVDLILDACSSNCTMAAKALIDSSHTPTISIVTGGDNIDHAGPWVFRIGNSDTLNGLEQADYFIKQGLAKVALLTEETEYTQDIAKVFRPRFTAQGGTLTYDQNFLPGSTDF